MSSKRKSIPYRTTKIREDVFKELKKIQSILQYEKEDTVTLTETLFELINLWKKRKQNSSSSQGA